MISTLSEGRAGMYSARAMMGAGEPCELGPWGKMKRHTKEAYRVE